MMNSESGPSNMPGLTENAEDDDIVRQIIEPIRSTRLGHVQITIQDSGIVKIDKTEKIRVG
jgi:hypothetical protein